MNDLQIFNYGEVPVRTIVKDGEPWWVAKDVCEVLVKPTEIGLCKLWMLMKRGIRKLIPLVANKKWRLLMNPAFTNCFL